MVASLFATILNRKPISYSMSKEVRGRMMLNNHDGDTMINAAMEHVHDLMRRGANISIKSDIRCDCCYGGKSMKSNRECKKIVPIIKISSTITFTPA